MGGSGGGGAGRGWTDREGWAGPGGQALAGAERVGPSGWGGSERREKVGRWEPPQPPTEEQPPAGQPLFESRRKIYYCCLFADIGMHCSFDQNSTSGTRKRNFIHKLQS